MPGDGDVGKGGAESGSDKSIGRCGGGEVGGCGSGEV